MTRRGFFLLSGTAVLAAAAFRGFTRNSVASETGETFEVTKTDAEWKAILTDENGGVATVTIADVKQSNGVIHVIDAVLLPKM